MKSHPFPVLRVRSLLYGPYPRLVTAPVGALLYLPFRLSPLFDKTVTASDLQQMRGAAGAPPSRHAGIASMREMSVRLKDKK